MITQARIATTDNIALSGAQTLQGVSLVAATDVVLVTGQADGTTNGPYVVQTGAWTRHTDHDTAAEFVKPWEIFIREGTYENWRFQFTNATTALPPTLGTSVLNFEPFAMEEILRDGPGVEIVDGIVRAANRFSASSTRLGPADIITVDSEGFIGLYSGRGLLTSFLRGFEVEYVSSTSIRVKAGLVWVPQQDFDKTTGSAYLDTINTTTNTTLPISGLSANTLYYLYTAPAGNGVDMTVELSAEAPVSIFSYGTISLKGPSTGEDWSRRYLGSFRTNASGQPYNFRVSRGAGNYPFFGFLEDTTAAPFRCVSGSAATANTTVNLGPSGLKLVPPTCRLIYARVGVNATSGVWLDNSEMSTNPAGGTGFRVVTSTERAQHFWIPLDSNQSFRFANVTTGGATNIDIQQYVDRR